MMRKILILSLMVLLVSCSLPFTKKKADTKAGREAKGEKAQKTEEAEPKPGDIKVIDGIEYIYAGNRKYMLAPYEPEYVWIRKDQYGQAGEDLLPKQPDQKGREETEKTVAKLEEDGKEKGVVPETGRTPRAVPVPPNARYAPVPPITFKYPSPSVKRRVIVTPIQDQTNYKEEHMGELATKRLTSRLENTGAIICVDPATIELKGGDLSDPAHMRTLNEVYGVQAVLTGVLSDVFTSTAKVEGKDEKETSFAISKMTVDVHSTETGAVQKQLLGRNPFFLSREKGDMSSEKAKVKAIDLSIELIADDLLKSILSMDWHSRIASIEDGKIYINAGRLSGLEKGNTLEAYSPGEQVVDPKTKVPLGKAKGSYKGDLEVMELFGVDASWAKVKKGADFSLTDLVYLKSAQE
jgi:hypothetical protein